MYVGLHQKSSISLSIYNNNNKKVRYSTEYDIDKNWKKIIITLCWKLKCQKRSKPHIKYTDVSNVAINIHLTTEKKGYGI